MKDYLEYKGYLGSVNYSAEDKVLRKIRGNQRPGQF